jgi:hypothetical protein
MNTIFCRIVPICTLFAFLTLSTLAGANMVINGDFENNTAAATLYNLSNAEFDNVVPNATAFGSASEIDLITTDSPYGLPPVSGLWKVAIHRSSSGNNDAFSLTLNTGVVAGQSYLLDFYAQRVTVFDAGAGAVTVGVSGSPTAFGTLVFSGVASDSSWTHFTQSFQAPVNGQYLTVQIDPAAAPTWVHVDDFTLSPVPEPAASSLLLVAISVAIVVARRTR